MGKVNLLQSVEHQRRITEEGDREFFYQLQLGLLLALKERGQLDEAGFRCGERMLRCRYRLLPGEDREKEKTCALSEESSQV